MLVPENKEKKWQGTIYNKSSKTEIQSLYHFKFKIKN